jgi:predicted RND superfamily exporter protein
VAGALGVAGFYGFTQLETRFSFTDFLPQDSPYVASLELLESDFGGGFGEQTQVLVEATDSAEIDAAAHNELVLANQALVEIDDVSTVSTAQGEFVNAASPMSLLGQVLMAGPENTPPAVLEAAQEVGLGADLTVSPDADVDLLYRALLEAVPEQAARVIYYDGDRLDALLWDITTTAGEEVGDLRDGLDAAFAPVNALGLSAIDTSVEQHRG